MKVVLGVDSESYYTAASALLARLRFTNAVVDAVHVMSPLTCYPADPYTAMTTPLLAEVMEEREAEARKIVCNARERLTEDGLRVGATSVPKGSEVGELMDYADREQASLIAVGCSGKSATRAFFTGSVGRGLTIGAHQSLLVAKGEPKEGPIRAVLATDHSPYANDCVCKLRELAPQGIAHLTVMTAYPKEMLGHLMPYLPDIVLDPSEWVEQGLEQRNQQLIEKLTPLGCAFASRVIGLETDTAIKKAMWEADADLLILGAQGHGFIERLTLGSTSFHQVVAEPYSVLILRVPGRDEDHKAKPPS